MAIDANQRDLIPQGILARYSFSLVANLLRAGFVVAFTVVVARALGPAQFGDLNFLLTTTAAFVTLVDFGFGQAFFTLISQQARGRNFFLVYALFLFLQGLALLLAVCVLPDSLLILAWPEQSRWLVALAMLTSLITGPIWNFSAQLGESIRDTRGVQTRNLIYSVAVLFTLLFLTATVKLSVGVVLITQSLWYLLLGGSYTWRIFQRRLILVETEPISLLRAIALLYRQASPLIGYTIAGFFYVYVDSWLLRHFAGATEQGFFAVGMRFCIIASLATMAFLNIYWKEMAEAWARRDRVRLQMLFAISSRSFYIGATVLSAFALCWTPEIVQHVLGAEFKNAVVPVAILFLYPLHNTLNQMVELALLATGHARSKAVVGYFFFVVSLLTSYLCLAPSTAVIAGFSLGAVGMAFKTVACQFLQTNLGLFFLRRQVGLTFGIWFQFWVMVTCGLFAVVCRLLSGYVVGESPILAGILMLGCYFVGIGSVLILRPRLLGITGEHEQVWKRWVINLLAWSARR